MKMNKHQQKRAASMLLFGDESKNVLLEKITLRSVTALQKIMLFVSVLVHCAFATNAVCQPPSTARPPKTFYVKLGGNDSNNGTTLATAFSKVQTGIDHLEVAGDSLLISPGTYTEFVIMRNKIGTPGRPIVIKGLPGLTRASSVIIQGSITTMGDQVFNFHNAPNREWQLATGAGTHRQEYISKGTFPHPPEVGDWNVNRGTFVDAVNGRHTRLITYSRVEDLRSDNETYERILEGSCQKCIVRDPRVGPTITVTDTCIERRPWVYMGPGIWFDSATKKVHIRLSPTHNLVGGLAEYKGLPDPNRVPVSICEEYMETLIVGGSQHIVFRNISVKSGGRTIDIKRSRNVIFDDVIIYAGQYGVKTEKVVKLAFKNTIFDGGLPTWMFRNDLKDDYKFLRGIDTIPNSLGKNTMETLYMGNAHDDSTEMTNCEFLNAHDLYLGGKNFNFHHNWISNLHDEGLILDSDSGSSGTVHHNVMVQVLSALSFAGGKVTGPWYIYRNLIDLRTSTAGFRPANAGSDRRLVWRGGMPFKRNGVEEGPFDIFQNTFIVPFDFDETNNYPYNHLRSAIDSGNRRRSINNIFVTLNRHADQNFGIAYLPPRGFPAVVKGNLYYRKGFGTNLFYYPGVRGFDSFSCDLSENCSEEWSRNPYFQSTHHEEKSILLRDPKFISWAGEPDTRDDFRLTLGSPAYRAGVALPNDLKLLDLSIPGTILPDIGCYQSAPSGARAAKLLVGVLGRKSYPGN